MKSRPTLAITDFMAQTFRSRFFKVRMFNRYRLASGGTGPYTRVGRLTGMASTSGVPTSVANLSVKVIMEPNRYYWP